MGRTIKSQTKDFKVTLSYDQSAPLPPSITLPLIAAYGIEGVEETVEKYALANPDLHSGMLFGYSCEQHILSTRLSIVGSYKMSGIENVPATNFYSIEKYNMYHVFFWTHNTVF